MEFELELDSDSMLDTKEKEQTLVLPVNVKLYTPLERLSQWVFGCRHMWSFPFSSREIRYPSPYDTHQNCNKCGMMRFYRFRGLDMFSGPTFRKLINSESCNKERNYSG